MHLVHCCRDGNKWASDESLFESWGRNACLPDFMLWKILSCNCKRRNVSKRLGQLWQVTMNSRQHLVAGGRHFVKVLFTKNHPPLMCVCVNLTALMFWAIPTIENITFQDFLRNVCIGDIFAGSENITVTRKCRWSLWVFIRYLFFRPGRAKICWEGRIQLQRRLHTKLTKIGNLMFILGWLWLTTKTRCI